MFIWYYVKDPFIDLNIKLILIMQGFRIEINLELHNKLFHSRVYTVLFIPIFNPG